MNIRNLASSISKGQKTKLPPCFWDSSVIGLPAQNQWNISQLAEWRIISKFNYISPTA